MTTTVADLSLRNAARADVALRTAAVLWFLTALIGQWLFVYYIIGYFGGKIAGGGLPALADTHLSGGYIAGDLIGNIAVAAHILIAVIIHGGGPLQLIPQIRRRFPVFHHWTGRAFMFAAVVASISGLYIVWVRGTNEGWIADTTNTIDAVLIFIFAAMALRHAMVRDIATHRRWALRLFLAVSAVWFVRLGIYQSIYLARVVGVDFATIAEPVFACMHVAKILIPLGILEIYLRMHDRVGTRERLATAALLLVAAVLTGLGIYAVTTISWLPKVHG